MDEKTENKGKKGITIPPNRESNSSQSDSIGKEIIPSPVLEKTFPSFYEDNFGKLRSFRTIRNGGGGGRRKSWEIALRHENNLVEINLNANKIRVSRRENEEKEERVEEEEKEKEEEKEGKKGEKKKEGEEKSREKREGDWNNAEVLSLSPVLYHGNTAVSQKPPSSQICPTCGQFIYSKRILEHEENNDVEESGENSVGDIEIIETSSTTTTNKDTDTKNRTRRGSSVTTTLGTTTVSPTSSQLMPGYFRYLHEYQRTNVPPLLDGLPHIQNNTTNVNNNNYNNNDDDDDDDDANNNNNANSEGLDKESKLKGYFGKFFRKIRMIGSGGFGTVYLCNHILNGIELGLYAIKRVPVGDNHTWLKRVLKEVQIMERVKNHPNVVQYHHSWIENARNATFGPEIPCLFMLMEFMER